MLGEEMCEAVVVSDRKREDKLSNSCAVSPSLPLLFVVEDVHGRSNRESV